jgi:hypothetical protein
VDVTNAEREVSGGKVFYREAATNVPDEGALSQLCDGSQGLGLVAAKYNVANTQTTIKQTAQLFFMAGCPWW